MAVTAAADLELMRASMLLDADPAAAARRASGILADHPGHVPATLLLATASRRLGDPLAALPALELLAATHPTSPVVQLELGLGFAAAGRGDDAVAAFERAITLDPALAAGWRELATQRLARGDTGGGDLAYGRYRQLVQDPPDLTDAIVSLAENRLDSAEEKLRTRLDASPCDAVAWRLLADIASRREDHLEAERILSRCLAIAPGYSAARFDLARTLQALRRHAEVLPLVERLLAAEPHNIEYRSVKAHALRVLGRTAEAKALMDSTVVDQPGDERAWILRGHLQRELGEQALAVESYRRAIAVRADGTAGYWSLANLKTFRFSAADVAAMQALLARESARSQGHIRLEFALGKAFDDSRQYAQAFEHYARGNALQRATIAYDSDAMTDNVRRSKELYSKDFFESRAGWGSQKVDPIFIVGLPRSGSTLLEQILASHSQVEGTRELPDVPAIALDLMLRGSGSNAADYPDPIGTLDRPAVDAYARQYLDRTQGHRVLGRPRFVDKMLGNFDHIGLIQLMFPNAAVIDARRHPLGCGWSCYTQLFAHGLGFSYDLDEIGRYYRDYAALMEHIDRVLPARVHRVHYEQLVADPEGEVRRLLDYCQLPFETQCLRFYDNPRVVGTISSEQVRLPIYAESVDHWRHFEPWLGPLRAAIGETDSYPYS